MRIHFIDTKKRKYSYATEFSFGYFFMGPFYLFFRRRLFLPLGLLFLYYWLLPIPGLGALCEALHCAPWLTKVILFFRSGFPLWCGIFAIFFFHIFFSITADKLIMKSEIERKGLLPASDDDANNLNKISKKYKDLPVHPSFVKKITFINEEDSATIKKKSSTQIDKKSRQKQMQLDLLYEKYNSGFITQSELMERQEKILEKEQNK